MRKKFLTTLCFFSLLCVSTVFWGCETENPVCTDNFCFEGEVFPRANLGNREYKDFPGNIDESKLLTLLASNEQTADAVMRTTLNAIVSDVVSGNEGFLNKVVRFEATVSINVGRSVHLKAGPKVIFIVGPGGDDPNPIERMAKYKDNKSYHFIVRIHSVDGPDDTSDNSLIIGILQ